MGQLLQYQANLKGMTPAQILSWAVSEFGAEGLCMASSMGYEDQLLTHLSAELPRPIGVFFLDTGRHFPETYACLEESRHRYKVPYRVYAPAAQEVEEMVSTEGPNLFYRSLELRKRCCEVRKVKPLQRALAGKKAWVTGQRAEQSLTRLGLRAIEWDSAHNLYKLNPLFNWSEQQLLEEIKTREVLTHPLQGEGFPSIGCQPCTRAVQPGESTRAGRWWWEEEEHKECGLHLK